MRKLSFIVIILIVAALAGGSFFLFDSQGPSLTTLYENDSENLSSSEAKFLDVPFISQKEMYCSEASVAMVLHYYGKTQYTQEYVNENIAINFENMFPEIRNYLENCNYAFLEVEGLKEEIDENDPVIIRLDVKIRHTVVVVGYDENRIYAHDPAVGENLSITPEKLYKYWISSENGYWAIIMD